MSVAALAQILPLTPPATKNPTKATANKSSIEVKVVLFIKAETQPQTFMEAGKAIITVITKNKTRAL